MMEKAAIISILIAFILFILIVKDNYRAIHTEMPKARQTLCPGLKEE